MTAENMCSKIGLCVLFMLAFQGYFVSCAPKCNDNELRLCMDELKGLTDNQDLAFAQTENELNQTCGHLQGAMECVNNFTTRCFDDNQRQLYRTLTSGALQLLADLCTHGSGFRRRYLVHASCYRNLSSEYKVCADSYLIQQESTKKEEMTVKDRLRISCCLFDGYKRCTREAVLHKCSSEAADLGEQIVTKAGGPLIQVHCANFRHDSQDCMFLYPNSTSTRPLVFPLAMTLLLVLLSMAFRSHR